MRGKAPDANSGTPETSDRRGIAAAAAGVRPDGNGEGAINGGNSADLERYLHHLAHLDMALPLKIELIQVVRDMMQNFVDRAFGDDPVQQALRAGNDADKMDAPGRPDMVRYDPSQNQNIDLADDFGRNAGNRGGRKK